jgi:prophage regulatory protein
MAVQRFMRRRDVLAATGWQKSKLYEEIAEGRFPKGKRLYPGSNLVIWPENEIEAWQKDVLAAFAA